LIEQSLLEQGRSMLRPHIFSFWSLLSTYSQRILLETYFGGSFSDAPQLGQDLVAHAAVANCWHEFLCIKVIGEPEFKTACLFQRL
jgi:hypothetical protein